MKSIKEKAEEYDRIVKRISPKQSLVDMSGRKQFEAGANYVLEQIEQYCKEHIVCNSNIEHIIEQLKK